MFSQLAKRLSRVPPADLFTDHAHYIKNERPTVLSRNQNMAVGGTVSHHIFWYWQIYRFYAAFSVSGLLFLVNNVPPQSLIGICNIWLIRTTKESSYQVVFC